MLRPLVLLLLASVAPWCSATPAGQCTVTPVSPPPAGTYCGKQGKVLSGACIRTFSVGSQTACRDACLANTACASFSYAAATKTCKHYKKKLRESRLEKCNSGTYFWDRGCYTKTCTNTCPAGRTSCPPTGCVDLASDENHCGACNTMCPTDETCTASDANLSCGSSGCCYCDGPLTYDVTRPPAASYVRTSSGRGRIWPFANFQAVTTFAGTERRACDALRRCAEVFTNNAYPHFNLYWSAPDNEWYCVHSDVAAPTDNTPAGVGASLVYAPAAQAP